MYLSFPGVPYFIILFSNFTIKIIEIRILKIETKFKVFLLQLFIKLIQIVDLPK